jgi:hypothetical protein
MATTVREELQDEFLSTLRKGQEIALDALKSLVETIQSVTPSMPAVRVPLADRLPGAHEVVAGASDFTEHLLANQRQFAEHVVANQRQFAEHLLANQRQFVDEVITAASRLLPGMESAPAAKADEPAAKAAKAAKPAA